MASLKQILRKQAPQRRERVRRIIEERGQDVLAQINVAQAYGGLRGVRALVCDTSEVDPTRGLIVAGRPITELSDRLPEELFFLLCAGRLPTTAELHTLQQDLGRRAALPDDILPVLAAWPTESHPMRLFAVGVLALGRDSHFARGYAEGLPKDDYWEPLFEDVLDLLARLPTLAAAIYRLRFGQGSPIEPDRGRDWAAGFAHMLGIPDPTGTFAELMRLYLTVQCDHGAGDVSANACHAVASALADPYYAIAAALAGQAGPLHGLASQEVMRFVCGIRERFGGVPKDEQLRAYAREWLDAGRVIPGYGHAVLRATDPRFTALHDFGRSHCPDDPLFQIVDRARGVIPQLLRDDGRASNPYPNADAVSGVLLHHFGLREASLYTVCVALSRSIGLLAQLVLNRIIATPILRPTSVSTERLESDLGR